MSPKSKALLNKRGENWNISHLPSMPCRELMLCCAWQKKTFRGSKSAAEADMQQIGNLLD